MTIEYACTMGKKNPQHLLSALVWKRRRFDRKLRIPDAHQTLDELLNIYRHFINWRNLCDYALDTKNAERKENWDDVKGIHSFINLITNPGEIDGFIFILFFDESTDMIHFYIIVVYNIHTDATCCCLLLCIFCCLECTMLCCMRFSTLKYKYIYT